MRAQPSTAPFLAVQGVSKVYGRGKEHREVLRDVSFTVEKGAIIALLGASGCGKTTLLNILAGFLRADSGAVVIQGMPSTLPGPDKAVVFQEDALFPWLNVAENVTFGLRQRAVPERRRREIVSTMLELVGLAEFRTLLPRQLSGGMRQRVALARVLALEPKLLLMDEPFAALDALTREEMHGLLLDLHARFGTTTLLVTHDVIEAVTLADAVLLMGGQTIQDRVSITCPRPRDPELPEFLENVRTVRSVLRRFIRPDSKTHTVRLGG
ncbi:ABC transporter ATP-binding protein [Desulfonatronum thioautotrophicum]|uniref:ABC transporter ATP-binding protein n=1 Tax=Desulfonatronum thioautotrophicum TaxID=617001 RepID=UPI0005EB6B2D|nr:ABC transporter ATP-binding protein [Desulfonatronum thioautotrophicum]